jgi:RNA polymerase sigma-70 factor (ECF subfamily)
MGEPLWLEPYPDVMLEGIPDRAPGPEARYETKEAVALAFVTGLQHMAPRQRAVLVLRDVLGFSTGEVADMLETSEASVNSALQRARGTLDSRASLGPDARERAPLPSSAAERELLAQFAQAFEDADTDRIVALMTDDALINMPPEPAEYQGRETVRAFLRDRFAVTEGRLSRLVPTSANGQPAFGHYVSDAHSPIMRFAGVFVLTLEGDKIARLTRFSDTGILPAFGLPRVLR